MPGSLTRPIVRLRGSAEVFGCLAHLPVAILEGPFDRGVDLVAVERREREHGPPAHGRLVGRWRR